MKVFLLPILRCIVWGLCLVLYIPDTVASKAAFRIEYPEISVNDDQRRWRIQVHAVAHFSHPVIDGVKLSELSDLAWDSDEGLLYVLSDNGYLLSFRPVFQAGRLRALPLVKHLPLRDEAGKKLKWKNSDSEGLALLNADNQIKRDTQFIVSFERRPRVIRYRSDGHIDARVQIPAKLSDIKNYRSENKSLEAVTLHPCYGLMLGSEFSLKDEDKNRLGLYTSDGQYRSFAAHFDAGALTGVAITPQYNLIVIERAYRGLFSGFEVALHHLKIKDDTITDVVIADLTASDDLFNGNFEGIERHKDNFYFMVSDDNGHPLQHGVLIYFSYDEAALADGRKTEY